MPLKVANNRLGLAVFSQPAQNQPKSQFHKNVSPRDLYLMTLARNTWLVGFTWKFNNPTKSAHLTITTNVHSWVDYCGSFFCYLACDFRLWWHPHTQSAVTFVSGRNKCCAYSFIAKYMSKVRMQVATIMNCSLGVKKNPWLM